MWRNAAFRRCIEKESMIGNIKKPRRRVLGRRIADGDEGMAKSKSFMSN